MVKTELTDIQKRDLKALRIQQDFEDGNSKGSCIIDEVSSTTFLEFSELSRKYFGGKRGAALAGLVQIFLAEKSKQKALEITA